MILQSIPQCNVKMQPKRIYVLKINEPGLLQASLFIENIIWNFWVMSTKCEMHSKYLTSSKLGLIWARHKNLGKWLIWHNIRWKLLAFFKVWKFNYGVSSVNNCMCEIRDWVGLTTLHIYLMWFLHLTSTFYGCPSFH